MMFSSFLQNFEQFINTSQLKDLENITGYKCITEIGDNSNPKVQFLNQGVNSKELLLFFLLKTMEEVSEPRETMTSLIILFFIFNSISLNCSFFKSLSRGIKYLAISSLHLKLVLLPFFSEITLLPSSSEATIWEAFAIPIPFIDASSAIERSIRLLRLSKLKRSSLARSSADFLFAAVFMPVLSIIASSSPLVKCSLPYLNSFSLGLSSTGHLFIERFSELCFVIPTKLNNQFYNL